MRLADQRGGRVVGRERLRPIGPIHQCLAPSQARVWPLRLSRESPKAIDAVRTKDRLTEPAFVVAVPLVLRGPAAFKTLCPQWQEQTEIRQRPGGLGSNGSSRRTPQTRFRTLSASPTTGANCVA